MRFLSSASLRFLSSSSMVEVVDAMGATQHPGADRPFRAEVWARVATKYDEAIKAVTESRSLSAKPKVLGGSAAELDDGH